MKYIFSLLLLTIFSHHLYAQNALNYDKEKLLEYYQSQRYAEAAQYLQTVYPEDTQDTKALNQIAYCFMMAGKLPEAEKNYLKLVAQTPTSVPVLFNLANINLRRGNGIKAKSYFESIIQLDSTNFNAYKKLADLYENATDSQKVIYLIKANQINPIEADVALDLAKAYQKLKKYEPAYDILLKAIAADTGHLILQQAKLPIAIQLKKYREVIETGEKLLTAGFDANVAKDVGMAYFYLKNYEKAISYFKMLEMITAQTESTLYYTSLSYRNLNNYLLAAEYAKKTIEEGISPNTSSYYLLLGGIYEINNKSTSAVTAYKRGLTFKENGNIYYRLGILYDFKLNQKKSALTYYNRYLKSKPDTAADKEQISYARARLAELKK
ncbi:tetratricopeptide repeat protein [Pedobacter insulae]|uniref:Tetratricopeptide repeat-containing protein n=1 Tax=Pedobacter insulae TaxID=414048 RepID=A0A1I2VQT5_9SPHI|nr:tetratricopeptide repeat protein [Pedobacter insulae]SFG91510.1 Tetratricopeptide repeat-containing protein [Pedobacter insulae]